MPGGRGDACDEEGLRAAFLAHGAELLGFARKSLATSGLAEDAVQETFSRAWRSRSRFDPSLGSIRTWLFAIERRVIIDLIERASRHRSVPLGAADAQHVPDGVDAALVAWQVRTALDRLHPEHRMIVTELYFHGRSGREVAELFGIPEGTVRSRAFYALRTMRTMLEEAGWNP